MGPRPAASAPPATRGRPTLLAAALPLAPFLSVTSYIRTRADQNGSNARCRARPPAGPDAGAPSPRPPHEAPGSAASRRGKSRSGGAAGPSSEKALLLWPVPIRKPRASPTASASSNTFHGLPPAREPTAPLAGPRPRLEGSPPRGESSSGPSRRPPRARSRRAARRPAPMSGWATCDPRAPGRPLLPAGLARSRGLPDPAGNSDVRNFPGPRRAEPPPAPRTAPLPCSPEATIRAGGRRGARGARASARVGR